MITRSYISVSRKQLYIIRHCHEPTKISTKICDKSKAIQLVNICDTRFKVSICHWRQREVRLREVALVLWQPENLTRYIFIITVFINFSIKTILVIKRHRQGQIKTCTSIFGVPYCSIGRGVSDIKQVITSLASAPLKEI